MRKFSTMSYSVFKGEEYESLDTIAHDGPCVIFAPANKFFGGPESRAYVSKVYDSPTWGQVFLESMKAQEVTNDYQHTFLEGVTPCKNSGLTILRLNLGS